MTNIKYFDNSYIKKFKAEVIDIVNYKNNQQAVILNRTYFYPESGGQLSDKGKIGKNSVFKVLKIDGKIYHLIKDRDNIELHEKYDCFIDWNRRYDLMKQHSGQHLLSAIFEDEYGYKTKSFHMSEDYSYIDIEKKDNNKVYTDVEYKVNEEIWEDKVVKTFWIDPDEMDNYEIRKIGKYDNKIRIVEIEDIDISMCGGTHVNKIGEIGILKITNIENIKKNLERIYFLCGERALNYYDKLNKIKNSLKKILATEESEIVKAVKNQIDEKEKLFRDNKKLNEKLIQNKIEFQSNKDTQIVIDTVEDFDNKTLNYYANQLIDIGKKFVLIYDYENNFLLMKQDGHKYDLKNVGESLKQKYNSGGGGNNNIFQIVDINIKEFEEEMKELFKI